MAVKKTTTRKKITKNIDKGQVHLRLIIRLLRLPTIRVTLFASVRQAHSDLRVRESLPRSQRSRRAKRQRSPQKSMVLRV